MVYGDTIRIIQQAGRVGRYKTAPHTRVFCFTDMEKDTMKMKTVVNALIISSILLIAYLFIGHGFVEFYFGGKKEILETAALIDVLQC